MKTVRYFVEDHIVKPFPVRQSRINDICWYAYHGTPKQV